MVAELGNFEVANWVLPLGAYTVDEKERERAEKWDSMSVAKWGLLMVASLVYEKVAC